MGVSSFIISCLISVFEVLYHLLLPYTSVCNLWRLILTLILTHRHSYILLSSGTHGYFICHLSYYLISVLRPYITSCSLILSALSIFQPDFYCTSHISIRRCTLILKPNTYCHISLTSSFSALTPDDLKNISIRGLTTLYSPRSAS